MYQKESNGLSMLVPGCYVCGNSNCRKISRTSEWTLYECLECALLFKVGKRTDYEQLDLDEYMVFDYNRSSEVAELCNVLTPFFETVKGLNVVEIGAGIGSVLNEFSRRGAQVYGFEPSRVAAEHAVQKYGLRTILGEYFESRRLDTKPQVILLLDVIEHLEDPCGLFCKIADAMDSGTYLVVKSGDANTFPARFCREKWSYIRLPQHIAFYSKKTLEYLCGKAGLRMVRFHRYRHVYGGIAWQKVAKNLLKAILLAVAPKNSSVRNRYEIEIANDHFIAVIAKGSFT